MSEFRILSNDGGGIRGILEAIVINDIEQDLGEPIMNHFHMAVGTSTGAIAAGAVALVDGAPLVSGEDLVRFYRDMGPDIFSRSLWKRIRSGNGYLKPKYDHAKLTEAITDVVGNVKLSDLDTDLMITAYDIERQDTFMFKSWQARGVVYDPLKEGETPADNDFYLRDAMLATSAAPAYFEPHVLHNMAGERFALIDGGVFANNPAKCAHDEATSIFGHQCKALMLSLGTGEHTRPIMARQAANWGMVQWLPRVLGTVFNGVSKSVDHHLNRNPEVHYLRIQKQLRRDHPDEIGPSDDFDDASPDNIARLEKFGHQMLKDHKDELDRLKAHLKSCPLATPDQFMAEKAKAEAERATVNLPYCAYRPGN